MCFKRSHLTITVVLNPLSKQLQLVFCVRAKPNQIKSLIFSLYSANFVREVCGAYMAGSKFNKLISKCDFQKLNKRILSQVRYFDCIYNYFPKNENVSADCIFTSLRPYVGFRFVSVFLHQNRCC